MRIDFPPHLNAYDTSCLLTPTTIANCSAQNHSGGGVFRLPSPAVIGASSNSVAERISVQGNVAPDEL